MHRLIAKFIPGTHPQKTSSTHPKILQARQLLTAGEPDKATMIFNRVIAAEPKNAEAYSELGGMVLGQGRFDLAFEYFSKAVEIDPHQATYQQGLGIACYNLGRFSDALRYSQKAVSLDPKKPTSLNNLGNCYKQKRALSDAVRCYQKAIAANRTYLPAYINLADALGKQRKFKDSVKTYQKALRGAADTPENKANLVLLHHRLGLALRLLDKTDEAIASYKSAIAMQPDFAMAHNSLGGALLARNELDAAMVCFRKALKLEPDYFRVHSNVLLVMNYLSETTQKQLYAESLQFDARQCKGLLQGRKPFRNLRNKQKVLKIGYLSPDFREHSVEHFTLKLLEEHNREAVEVYCYANVEAPDSVTWRFQAQADHWLSIVDMKDEEIAEHIRQDGIDILIDLAGHTADNHLLVFARKPAPIQVNWLGYPNTTGMRAMDYRLTDEIADPPGDADQLHTEKLIRLKNGFLCYQTTESLPVVSATPYLQQGYITFGSFNTIKKVTPDVIRVWSQILQSIPDAHLVLKSSALEDGLTKTRVLQSFGEHDIAQNRIELINAVPRRQDHLGLYSKIDICLDPFPYNGTTTTFEALQMGVPVLCLRGDRHAGRVGASILHYLGLPELVTENENEYINLAQKLASDTQKLVTLRKALRQQMHESVLMDVPLFTKTLEGTFREMWVTWCNKRK